MDYKDFAYPNYSQWRQLVFVYKTSLEDAVCYLNGTVVPMSGFGSLNQTNVLNTVSTPLKMYGLIGDFLDDVRIYNNALSDTEVKALYDSEKSPASDLVAYYPFNGNANDESGNGNNGTVNGATLTTDRFGKADSAYNFNGKTTNISTNYDGILGASPRTISIWAKSSYSPLEVQGLLEYGTQIGGKAFGCFLNAASHSIEGVNICTNDSQIVYKADINDGIWHHYVWVLPDMINPKTSDVKIYMDSKLLTVIDLNYNQDVAINTTKLSPVILGGGNYVGYYGDLDDVRIYSKALSASDVQALYDSEKPTTSDLVAYYPFNGNANDESGNGNNGAVNGATLTTDRFGNANKAYSFDGVNDYISINNIPLSEFSVTAWVYVDSVNDILGSVVSKINNPPDEFKSFQLFVDRDSMKFMTSLGNLTSWQSLESKSPIEKSKWYFMTGVYNKTEQKMILYLDGAESASQTVNGYSDIDNPVFIGARPTGSGQYFLGGKIDDVRIYSKALSASDVQALYDSEKPKSDLVAYYPFNGNANDESGNGNNGTVNGATLTTDRFGNANSAYSFDGTTNYIQVQPSNSLDQTNLNAVTFSTWFYPEDTCGSMDDQRLINVGGTIPGTNDISYKFSTGKVVVCGYDSSNYYDVPSNTALEKKSWYLLVVKYDYVTNNMKIYVNGVLDGESTKTVIKPESNSFLTFGKHSFSQWCFKGKIDDARVYNRGLSDAEIKALYDSEKPAETSTWPTSWTKTGGATTYPWQLKYADGKFATLGHWSTDGITWNNLTPPPYSYWMNDIGYGGGLWVIACPQGQVFTSPNLTDWTKRPTPDNDDITTVSYGNSTFVLRKYWQGGNMLRSTDGGATWATVSTGSVPGDARAFHGVAFGNEKFVYALDTSVRISTDGSSWTEHAVDVPEGFTFREGVPFGWDFFDGTNFIACTQTSAVGNTRTISTGTSTDGINWTFKTASIDSPIKLSKSGVTGGIIVLSGCDDSSSKVFISTDKGSTWKDVSGPWSDKKVKKVAFGGGVVVVATEDGFYKGVPQATMHTVTFIAENGGTLSGQTTQTVSDGSNCTAVVAVPDTGYRFVNWTGTGGYSSSTASLTVTNVTSDMNLTANFASTATNALLMMAVSPDLSGSTSPTAGTISTVSTETALPITATPGTGYTFVNWTAYPPANARFGNANSAETNVTLSATATITANFTKNNAITITSPNGGEKWQIGTTQTITWTSAGIEGAIRIDLYKSGKLDSAITTETLNDGSYSWEIPAADQVKAGKAIAAGSFYKVRVSSATDITIYDESDNNFSITDSSASIAVTAPISGSTLELGGTTSITWTSNGITGNLKIDLYKGGVFVTTLAPDEADDSAYAWNISSTLLSGTDYTVKVTSLESTGVSGSSSQFALTSSGSTATLTMALSPVEGGIITPPAGVSTVNTNLPVTVTADANETYTFVRWSASPTANASIANPNAPVTTVTLTGDTTVTALFSSTGSGYATFDANSKVKITVDSSKQSKDSVSIMKGKLPQDFVKPVEGDPITIMVDEWSLPVNGGYKAAGDGNKITYKGETVANGAKTNKYQLALDFKKLEWNLRVASADLSTGTPVDSFDGLDVMLNINGTLLGQNIETDDTVKWRFSSEKNGSEQLDLTGEEWLNFAVNKADGSKINYKPSKDAFNVGSGSGDIIAFDSAADSIIVSIDGFEVALDDADEGSAWKSGNGRHTFKGTFGGVTVVQFVLDLSKESATWKFKISKADFWDDVDGSDGLDFRVIIGGYEGGLQLGADQITTMSYPQK